jgi:hypothetical protein
VRDDSAPPRSLEPGLRTFLPTFGRALLGLFAGLAAVDLGVGWLDHGQAEAKSALFVRDGELGWTNRPGFRDEGTALDSLGLRSPEASEVPEPGEVRVLVCGASDVYGLGVRDEETWRHHLQAELDELHPGRVRVFNAAVQGYSIVQECRRVRRLIPLLQPDLAIVFAYPGRQCLLDHSPAQEWVQVGDEMVPADLAAHWPERLSWVPATIHRVLRFSSIYVRHRTMTRLGGKESAYNLQFVLSRAPRRPETEERLASSFQEVADLVEYARSRGVELRFVLNTGTEQVNEGVWEEFLRRNALRGAPPVGTPRREPIDVLAEWLAPTGVETWDFYPVISYMGADLDQFILSRNNHWSPKAHRLVARALLRHLTEGGLLERLLREREGDLQIAARDEP